MNHLRHLVISVCLALGVLILGTIGYMAIEGWNLLDSVYMTVITLGTVGYGEVHPINNIGKIFTIFLIMVGFVAIGYIAATVVQFMVEGRIRAILGRRRLDNKISRLKDHFIVCGYGRIGRVLCEKMREKPLDLVVIDKNEAMVSVMDSDEVLYICGDATQEETLIKAGIGRAKGLIAVLGTDAENVFLVLTARQLNKDLMITARAAHEDSKSKLISAGANRVESPYDIGASSMAQRILRPTVTSFLDFAFANKTKDIQMEEIPVEPSSDLVDVMLKDSGIRQQLDLIIIAIKKSDGSMLFNPSSATTLFAGDTVIAVGQEADLQRLEKILNPTLKA